MHLEELQAKDERCARNETILWKTHTERFSTWIKDKVCDLDMILILLCTVLMILICHLFMIDTK